MFIVYIRPSNTIFRRIVTTMPSYWMRRNSPSACCWMVPSTVDPMES